MSNNSENTGQPSSTVNKAIIGLLSASLLAAASAGLGVWKQSALIEQRITSVDAKHLVARDTLDNKYIEKSNRVIKRVDALAMSLATHFADDNAHQLSIQKVHLGFENFMGSLKNAHIDLEDLKHDYKLAKMSQRDRLTLKTSIDENSTEDNIRHDRVLEGFVNLQERMTRCFERMDKIEGIK